MMTGMMRNIRSWPKASSTISKRRNRSCFRSLKAGSMRQKWRLVRNSFKSSLTNVRPKPKVALEHGNRGKESRLKGEREYPEDNDKATGDSWFICHKSVKRGRQGKT